MTFDPLGGSNVRRWNYEGEPGNLTQCFTLLSIEHQQLKTRGCFYNNNGRDEQLEFKIEQLNN